MLDNSVFDTQKYIFVNHNRNYSNQETTIFGQASAIYLLSSVSALQTEVIITPTPTVTPTPEITPTPIITPTPVVTPTPTVSPTPTATPTPIIDDSWSQTQVYNGGDVVLWKGLLYQARWWTQGQNPTESGEWGVWKKI